MSSRIVYTPREAPRTKSLRKILFFAVASAGAILLPIGIVFVLRLPSLQMREVTFSGLQSLEESVLQERVLAMLDGTYAFVLPQSSYFLADSAAISSRLREKFPRLAAVSVAKRFPDTLAVVVTERAFWGIFCNSTQSSSTPACVSVDSSGFAYERAPEPQGSLIRLIESDMPDLVEAGGRVVDSVLMERLRFFSEELERVVGAPIIGYELRSRVPSEIRTRTAEGYTIILKRDDDFANVWRVLQKVLDEEIGGRRSQLDYIDLRFGNKVFYKLR